MTGSATPPGGGKPRILVAEDEFLVAAMLQQILEDLGFECAGPCGTLSQALAMARTEPLDAAIVDLNLVDEDASPLVDVLLERNVPVGLSTGLSADGDLHSDRGALPRMMKPFMMEDVRTLLRALGFDL